MGLSRKISWPFKFTNATKNIKQKMDFWVINVKDKPILLTRNDYDALLQLLPRDYVQIGKPMWEGREIKRMGDKN